MNSTLDDLVELSDYAWQRLRRRMDGLTDEEYRWEPVPDCRTVRPVEGGGYRSDGPARDGDPRVFTTLAWRLSHIGFLLQEDRNGAWLGVAAPPPGRSGDPGTAAAALADLDAGYAWWRSVLAACTDESLAEPIGRVGGPFGESTRRAFVLHILDELIHHGAEAALLRDLYRSEFGETRSAAT
ncbi:MAG: DinB family protein [Mycobacteriales bacterium]